MLHVLTFAEGRQRSHQVDGCRAKQPVEGLDSGGSLWEVCLLASAEFNMLLLDEMGLLHVYGGTSGGSGRRVLGVAAQVRRLGNCVWAMLWDFVAIFW